MENKNEESSTALTPYALKKKVHTALEIIELNKQIKSLTTLLNEKKDLLADGLPEEGFTVGNIKVSWTSKVSKTIQKALVEEHFNIELTDAEMKVTPMHYVTVTELKG